MTDDLHDVSLSIGQLKAENTESQRQRDAMFKKLDRISEDITKLTGAVELLARDHGETSRKIKEDIMPTITEFRNLKQRGMGIIAFIGLVGSGVGATLITAYQKWAGI